MSKPRVSDLAILLGHTLQCEDCRQRLLAEPDRVLVGRKIAPDAREKLLAMDDEDFESATALAAAGGLSVDELYAGVDHPRARLRHL